MRLRDILLEMVVRFDDEDDASPQIIAHRDSIWLVDVSTDDEDVIEDIRARTGLEGDTIADMIDEIADVRPDIVLGTVYRDRRALYLSGTTADTHSRTNPLVRKVMQTLGLRTLEISRVGYSGDEYEDEFHAHDVTGDIPEVVFHGTNSKYINAILRVGIRPTENANWKNIGKFSDKVFLTASFDNAMFHAMRQAETLKAYPIIIATRIPDRTRIARDFDVASRFYGDDDVAGREGYSHSMRGTTADTNRRTVDAIAKHSPGTDFTRATGIMGYRGSVAPTNFVTMYVPATDNEDGPINHDEFVEVPPEDFWKALDMLHDFGYYDPSYEPEEPEETEEQPEDEDDI